MGSVDLRYRLVVHRQSGASLRARMRGIVWPYLAALYRQNPRRASSFLLSMLGIADTADRQDFETLTRIVDRMPTFDGQIIECGVYRGSTLLGIAHRLGLRGIRNVGLIGCDSFEGFPTPSVEDALSRGEFHTEAHQGFFSDTSYEVLLSQVSQLGYGGQIRLLKGFFSDTLPELSNCRFSIAHLDCDLYQSYLTCLDFLYPRMVPGGCMVFDEYDFSRDVYPGAQRALDEFFSGRPEKLQRFPDVHVARYFIVKE